MFLYVWYWDLILCCVRVSLAADQAYSLGLLNFSSACVSAACVCFCELLGVCSLKLRVDLRVLNLVLRLWTQTCEDHRDAASLRQALGTTALRSVSLGFVWELSLISLSLALLQGKRPGSWSAERNKALRSCWFIWRRQSETLWRREASVGQCLLLIMRELWGN